MKPMVKDLYIKKIQCNVKNVVDVPYGPMKEALAEAQIKASKLDQDLLTFLQRRILKAKNAQGLPRKYTKKWVGCSDPVEPEQTWNEIQSTFQGFFTVAPVSVYYPQYRDNLLEFV